MEVANVKRARVFDVAGTRSIRSTALTASVRGNMADQLNTLEEVPPNLWQSLLLIQDKVLCEGQRPTARYLPPTPA